MVYVVWIVFALLIALIPLKQMESIEILKRDYPKYAGLFKSPKFRKSFVKKINLEEQIKSLKEELSAVNFDVEFYIEKINQDKGESQ